MEWSLLPNTLRPFKIYCAPPTIISQLFPFVWQTVEIHTLGHVRVVKTLQYMLLKHILKATLNGDNFQVRVQNCFCTKRSLGNVMHWHAYSLI